MLNILLLSLLTLPALAQPPAEGPVKASWKAYYYSGPQYRGYDCAYAEQALRDFLASVEARGVRSICHWSSGLSASWEALSPVKENSRRQAVEKFLSSQSGPDWLSGLSQSWAALTPGDKEEKVDAVWQRGVIQQYMSGAGRVCNIYADVADYLLDALPLRNVSYNIFCDYNTGFININFEYLALPQ